jgi:ATP-dependent protease ClpP protease subunit
MKEIILYNYLYDASAANFIAQLEAYKDEDVVIRMNTGGGSPESTFGMIAKLSERTKATKIKVDGKANSMGAFMLAYTQDNEALDVSEILIHRAAYPSWVEKDANIMTPEMWSSLNRVNGKLREALEAKVNATLFQAITGKTMDDVFNTTTRIDVILTAQQAKEIGLINKVVNITPTMQAEIKGHYAMAAQSGLEVMPFAIPEIKEATTTITIKNNTMTVTELNAQYPNLVADIVASERDRVNSFLVFAHLDLDACKKGISEGSALSATQMAEFTLKAAQAQFMLNAENGSPANVTPAKVETPQATEAKQEADFWKEAIENVNIK